MLTPLVRPVATVVLAAALVPLGAGAASARASFTCGTVTGGTTTSRPVHITDIRVGHHATYDRFVIEFSGRTVPSFSVIPKNSSVFWLDPSDRRVQLRGTAGIKVVLHSATGQQTYHGPTDIRPGFPQLREARRIGDFEGVTTWGLGLQKQSCKRVFTLRAPVRLVVDVPATTS